MGTRISLLHSALFQCPKHYFHPVTEKPVQIFSCSLAALFRWDGGKWAAGGCRLCVNEGQAADGSCETARRAGMAALHTQRSWLSKAHSAHLVPLKPGTCGGDVTGSSYPRNYQEWVEITQETNS